MGRHGGINILHQKSWHVWRMDNRLKVERDELQHAAAEREVREEGQRAAFTQSIERLRRRAEGLPEIEAQPQQTAVRDARDEDGVQNSERSMPSKAKTKKEDKNSYKYGQVTLSNLKVAEQHLDMMLQSRGSTSVPAKGISKGKGKGKSKGKPEVAPEDRALGGLGTAAYINLFEEAEATNKQHGAEHAKQLRYTDTNRELLGESHRGGEKRTFSEFDEISNNVPWYMKSRQEGMTPRRPSNTDSGERDARK
eukprot:TRINITY_DN5291_c0_g1_i3.p1 TRINITY_DN5291_c0_g1~~TRINITY_DN5291_c0_g1_i3.p1  ORF type:complete len:252 (+),score=53.48 TRINITY_DN5291_c0_g1_i3:96-851(+)